MRKLSAWSVASSLFFSVTLFTSSYEAATGVAQLAGIGNPGAIEQSLSGFVSRMGSDTTVPKAMAEAHGRMVAVNARIDAARLQRQKDWVLKEGDATAMSLNLSGLLGLTDGRSQYQIKLEAWQDDNDKTLHYVSVGLEANPAIVFTFKPADTAYVINWRTDVNGQLVRTTYTDSTGTRIIPNSNYAKQFQAQMTYWDALVPNASTVATSTARN